MERKASEVWFGIAIALIMVVSSLGLTHVSFGASADSGRTVYIEQQDDDTVNNDNFIDPIAAPSTTWAQEVVSMSPDEYLVGNTGLGDPHRIDNYVLKDVPAGTVINASVRITNFNNQALLVSGWNKYHQDNLAWSNREDNPDRRQWEAVSFMCVVTGDYYIQVKPIAGQGTDIYWLNVQMFDPQDITSKIGSGGAYGQTISGQASSLKWYPGTWYKFQLTGEQNNMNDYLYVNMTEPGSPTERLQGDIYVTNLEPETWSYWLNQSWWLDSFVQYEEVHVAACQEGTHWYFMDIQAYNTTGGRSENYELRITKTLIESDGDNHPTTATPVTYEMGKTTVRKTGSVIRGPDMFDWYKVDLSVGEGVSANLTLTEKATAIFRLSIYRDNLTSPFQHKGYDVMSTWTNKPGAEVLSKVNALVTNVSQAGWYYIGVIAQIGLVPWNVTNLADWTVQTAWARYNLDITLPDRTVPPIIENIPSQIVMNEGTSDSSLQLNFTNGNNGVFYDADFAQTWGDALSFSSGGDPNFQVTIGQDDAATVTLTPNQYWNGEANLTFTATDLYGKVNSTVVHVRVNPVENPPFVKARIPDFIVEEGKTNLTMKDIDLFNVFGDPDFPPLGVDNLTFSVENSFPSVIVDSKLTFGQAPVYSGKDNTHVVVTITATDMAGKTATTQVNITVININHPPVFNETNNMIEIFNDVVSYYDLHGLFFDPDNDQVNFAYLGGAPDNLTVEIAPNGTVVLKPSRSFWSAQEVLKFKAIDTLGANATGELMIRIINVNQPPYILPGGQVPDPLELIPMNEGDQQTFRVSAGDVDNKSSDLRYTWYIDEAEKTLFGTSVYTWKTTFDDAGDHNIRCRISDGIGYVDAEWNITVANVNQAPLILDVWPLNNTEVAWDFKVTFRANASDPDGNPITFYWRESDGTLLKTQTGVTQSVFTKTLAPGKQHIIVLEVQDNQGGVTRQYIYIKVGAKSGGGTFIPGFETVVAFAAVALAVVAIALMRRRN